MIKKLLLTHRVKLINHTIMYIKVFSVTTANGILNVKVQHEKRFLEKEHIHFSVKDGTKYLEIRAGKVMDNSR